MIKFANPHLFWLFLLYLPIIWWYIKKQRIAEATLKVSTLTPFNNIGTSWKAYLRHILFGVRMLALACLIIILCRPQTYDRWSTSETEGTDIVVALDVSTSMLARDFNPDRFEAAKDVASQFITGRESDNIGMVIFAGESFTLVPMTTDKTVLINYIQDINMGMLVDGTAIGDGIATSINRIKNGKAKSKSIILLTDGSNNTGVVAPLTAAEIAKNLGIKIYTIGVGKNGEAEYPVGINYYGKMEYQMMPVVIDEATLQSIASMTGGKYYRATDKNVLKEVFKDIDQLEKTEIDVKNFTQMEDDYIRWAILLLIFICIDFVCRYTILRHIP